MVEYGTLAFLVMLQSLAEVFQGDLGAIGPQVRDQIALTLTFSYTSWFCSSALRGSKDGWRERSMQYV